MMKLTKSILLMMIGAGAVLAYQKYNEPIMKKINEIIHNGDKQLENMMN